MVRVGETRSSEFRRLHVVGRRLYNWIRRRGNVKVSIRRDGENAKGTHLRPKDRTLRDREGEGESTESCAVRLPLLHNLSNT
jgi:hypothetical protein